MGEVKEINIKNWTYYYFDNMIDIRIFELNLQKIDKKLHRDFDIYYIGYDTIKKLSNCNCDCDCDIRSMNPLYLIIHSATGYFEYQILDSTEKINSGKELFYEKNYSRIGVNTDDDVLLNKPLKFPMLTIIIKCVFQEGELLYTSIYLDECLYKSV